MQVATLWAYKKLVDREMNQSVRIYCAIIATRVTSQGFKRAKIVCIKPQTVIPMVQSVIV